MKIKIATIMMVMIAGLGIAGDDMWSINKDVRWSSVKTIETNKVSETTYKQQTNGYTWVNRPAVCVGNFTTWTGAVCNDIISINHGYAVTTGISGEIAPDPFKEKITIEYFVVTSKEVYSITVGPMTDEYATRYTVLKRWQTKLVQKINMVESTETKQD